ncbi:CAP domain-containing protein [Massilia sp. LXY-6]|uniref:CAP domain-containing protein n=1 Tax=Massilia sp. LXY-6 TaxID=3379823 RepID=UPI003EE0CF25
MMNKTYPAKHIVAACVAALALAACGGGSNSNGSSSGSASGVTGGTSTGFSGQDASAPALTSDVATDGFNWINYRRAQAGVGVLARNGMLDHAAQAHSDYQRLNGKVTHTEDPTKPGFTGADEKNRVEAAGYALQGDNIVGEIIAATNNNTGFYMAEQLVTAIYHRFVMFEPLFREMGAGSAKTSANYLYFTTELGATRGYSPGLPSHAIATWPVNGQTGVPPNFLSDYEEPDPVPDLNEVGYPISIHANLTETVAVQSFTVRPRGGGDLKVRLLVKGQDANTTMNSVAAIIPLAPLAANTTYDVSFTGTVGGAAVTKTWSFTTK